jgi:hypothetical protein
MTLQRLHVRRPRPNSQDIDCFSNSLAGRHVKLPKRSIGTGPKVDGVGGHAVALYRPNSALT